MRNTLFSSVLALSLLAVFSLRGAISEVLPPTLQDLDGNPVSLESLEGKMVGIYFTASWCPPCRQFTPGLVALRDANQEDFEVVLVGFDRTPEAHAAYRASYKMGFPAVEFRSEASQALAERFGVRGIPHLAIIGPDGKVISPNAVAEVRRNADAAIKGWRTRSGQP